MTICLAIAVSSLLPGIPGPVQAVAQTASAPAPETPPKLPQILAFDLPSGVAGGAGRIQGFVVGYFEGDAREPRWVLDVARELARINQDGSVRIMLPLSDLPVGIYSARVKIRAGSVDSDWSAPSPPFLVPELSRRRARRTASSEPGASVARPPRGLNLAPAIAEAVRPLLPKDADLPDATRGFQKPVEFVTAVLAARNLGIALPDLKAAMFPPSARRRTLNSALAELRPDRDANKEARKALEQARRLIRDAHRKGRPPAAS